MEINPTPTLLKYTIFYKISRFRMVFNYLTVLAAIVYATDKLYLPALILVFTGMIVRTWAAGHIVKRDIISTGGPYAYTRNPLYAGSFIAGVGTFSLIHNWWLLLAFLAGFILFYGCAIRSEEDYLFERHGEAFISYKKIVPVFFPRLKPDSSLHKSTFAWNIVVSNNEHKSIFWSLVAIAAIFIRAYYF